MTTIVASTLLIKRQNRIIANFVIFPQLDSSCLQTRMNAKCRGTSLDEILWVNLARTSVVT